MARRWFQTPSSWTEPLCSAHDHSPRRLEPLAGGDMVRQDPPGTCVEPGNHRLGPVACLRLKLQWASRNLVQLMEQGMDSEGGNEPPELLLSPPPPRFPGRICHELLQDYRNRG